MKNIYFQLTVCISFVIVSTFITTLTGSAQTGVRDLSFGDTGIVITKFPFDAGNDSRGATAREIAQQPDGKILVAVGSFSEATIYDGISFLLLRYNVNGSLDSSFGKGGIAMTKINEYDAARVYSLALQKDGKIILAGCTVSDRFDNTDYVLVRFNRNGSLDSSFGNNGIVITDDGHVPTDVVGRRDVFCKVLVRPDGKILAAASDYPSWIVQYTASGTLDSTFGTNGKAEISPLPFFYTDHAGIALQDDGKLIAAGYVDGDYVALRLLANGELDNSFGNAGKVSFNFFDQGAIANSVVIQPDGKMIIAGWVALEGKTHVGLLRLDGNGTPDKTFGDGGSVVTAVENAQFNIYDIALQADGKPIVSGTISYYTGSYYEKDIVCLRYNSNGTLDNYFGKHGIIITNTGSYNEDVTSSIIQADGKLILGGGVSPNIVLIRYSKDPLIKYNTIKGSLFLDNNGNHIKDSNEDYFNDANIVTSRTGIDTITTVASNGQFSIDIDTATYVTTVVPYTPYYNIAPVSHTTSNATYFNTDSTSFAVEPIVGKRDLSASLISLNPARPGFPVQYKLIYTNVGTDTIPTGRVTLVKNSKLDIINASTTPDYIKGDTIIWNFSNFKPLNTSSILVDMTVKAPPSVVNGDTLHLSVNVSSSVDDLTPYDNTSTLTQRVIGSYDPNDKVESHGGRINMAQLAGGEYLQYTIRFQNTGTDTAFNVYIHDTLDSRLDSKTLQLVSASNNVQLKVSNGNILSFSLNDINLPDSNVNELLSHGYITYRIKPSANVSVNDTIYNTAGIYFDYNLPVYTNVDKTAILSRVLPLKIITFTAIRKGKTNLLNWKMEQGTNISRFGVERGKNGREYFSIGEVNTGLINYSFIDNTPERVTNYYRLKIMYSDGSYEYSDIKTVNNSGNFNVSLFPNPAKERLGLQLDTEKETNLKLEIIDIDGRIVMSRQVTATVGTTIKTVDITSLTTGQYFIRVVSVDKVQTVLKFEKI